MSSRITVSFKYEDSIGVKPEWIKSFTVRHLRNMQVTESGAVEKSAYGGYTVLGDTEGNLSVSKCHPKHDIFCRNTGITIAISHWLRKNDPGYRLTSLKSISGVPNQFVAILTSIASYV